MQVVEAADWFRVTPLGEGVTLVEEPYVSSLVSANLWHVRGRDRDLVLDAGLGVTSLRTALPWLFEHDPVLVLSHAHLDHMGGAHEFADVRVGAAEVDEVRRPGPSSLHGPRLLELLGLDPEGEQISELLLDALPDAAYDVDAYGLHGMPEATGLHEGDVLDLGDRAFTVLHLPGHTPGSLNLLEPETGLLLTGDVLYEGGLIDGCTGADPVAYRATMERLLDLSFTRALPGHGRVLAPAELHSIASAYLDGGAAATL
ncbi:MAG: MBL fold metallo-hydrolase [Candidatus Nanopelagicales bacterium]